MRIGCLPPLNTIFGVHRRLWDGQFSIRIRVGVMDSFSVRVVGVADAAVLEASRLMTGLACICTLVSCLLMY